MNTTELNNIKPFEHDYRSLVSEFGSPLLILDQAVVRKQY